MGGTKARIAVAAASACGVLLLGAPAASAAGPIDQPVEALPPASQAIDGIASPTVDQAVSTVREAANVPPPIEHATPAEGNGRAAVPATPVQHGPRSTHRADRTGAVGSIARDSRPERIRNRTETNSPSPPHGRKEMPPARSHRERAAWARAAHGSRSVAPEWAAPQPHRPGLTRIAQAIDPVIAIAFAVSLLLALATSLPFLLRPLRIPAPISRRPAFVSAFEPPG